MIMNKRSLSNTIVFALIVVSFFSYPLGIGAQSIRGELNQETRNGAKEVITFSTPQDVFNFLQSRVFKSSDGITLDIRPSGVKANSRLITAAVQVTYIRTQQAILKANSPLSGHTYTFIVYADKNCIVCSDDNTMYFGKKE